MHDDSSAVGLNSIAYLTERHGPRYLLIHPSGKFVYVSNWDRNTLSAYAIDPDTGSLTPLPRSPYPTGTQPRAITLTPNGQFLYAGNWGSGTLSGYRVDQETGVFQQAGDLAARKNVHLEIGDAAIMHDPVASGFALQPVPPAIPPQPASAG